MDTTHILEIAGKYISGINEVQDNIFKGTLNVGDKLAGVYYFDLNNKPVDDFETYQERLLADEFYSHPGNLQWNYYLFLVNDQLGDAVKESIEKNDKYARKFVLNETEFDDFFTFDKSDASIRPNIVSEWKRKLDEVGLQDVYSNRTYVDLVSQFKAGVSVPPQQEQVRQAVNDSEKIEFINRLVLNTNYRRFPVQRDFRFGKVNLFRGINGVGKTSLFEAIEAIICGKCLRNPSVIMPQGCIAAQFNNDNHLISYDGRNSRKYIDRDLAWYATNSRSNTLYNSFNRFNFFNADAAHNFSIAATEKEASEALFSIILGPEYHYISERSTRTLERLRPEFNRLKDEMQLVIQRRERAEQVINNYKEPIALRQLRNAIQEIYLDMHFKNATKAEDVLVIEERNNQLRPIAGGLLSQDDSILTLAVFTKAYAEFDQKRKVFETKEKELRTLTEKQTALSADEKSLNNHYRFLSRCIAYVGDEQLMKLDGLQAKEGEANLQKSKILFVKDLIGGIKGTSNSIKQSGQEIEDAIKTLNAEIKSDESEMTRLLNSFGQLEKVITQIRSHGKEFLELDHSTAECQGHRI